MAVLRLTPRPTLASLAGEAGALPDRSISRRAAPDQRSSCLAALRAAAVELESPPVILTTPRCAASRPLATCPGRAHRDGGVPERNLWFVDHGGPGRRWLDYERHDSKTCGFAQRRIDKEDHRLTHQTSESGP
jgi:hypothetical protein